MSIEVMKLALEALECINEGANKQGPHTGMSWRDVSARTEPAIFALRDAIAEQQDWSEVEALRESLREHMAEIRRLKSELVMQRLTDVQQEMEQGPAITRTERGLILHVGWDDIPAGAKLYTHLPRREWVGLTDEDIAMLDWESFATKRDCVQAIEVMLKEKNT